MKTNETTEMTKSFTVEKNQKRDSRLTAITLAILLMIVSAQFAAQASKERLVLKFNDAHITSFKGRSATLYLKKSLKQQYPHVDVRKLDLRRVVLVAKSRMGSGGAQLRVGNWQTEKYTVDGHPRIFRDKGKRSFDRVRLFNPSRSSRGPWQVKLNGNLVVRKVILEVENHSRSRHHRSWRGHFR